MIHNAVAQRARVRAGSRKSRIVAVIKEARVVTWRQLERVVARFPARPLDYRSETVRALVLEREQQRRHRPQFEVVQL